MLPDTMRHATQQLISISRENIQLVSTLWHKPEVFRYWLMSAHKAQLITLVLLVLIPFAITPLIDLLLSIIFPPVTKETLFGLIKTEQNNPYNAYAQTITFWLIWIISTLFCVILFLRHIPHTLKYAQRKVAEKTSSADQLLNTNASESILLYTSALEWSIDKESEIILQEKLKTADAMTRNTEAASHIASARTLILPDNLSISDSALIADRYRIKQLIGSGAMGNVYHGVDTLLKRDIALKQLSPSLSHDEHIIARFRQEALALARLSHPNIVQVFDFIEGEGFFWIVMELISGGELEQKFGTSQPLELKEALRLAHQMAMALGYAHSQGVIHRDFKPANVLLTKNGDIKITDFGIAKLAQSGIHTQLNTIMGTPSHMSPEQANGEETDHRTDIYALGIVLYQMISGELPFNGDAKSIIAQHLTKQAPYLSEKQKNISPALDNVIHKMLAKTPDERFQSMHELVEQLIG
ncbi:Serine/threonine protein kinase PrkC, regulator of stationary phase [hydrothermal vent metagenome]|uniref:Serine/threonine protein kinase PrkC, regulator of stationary phase n=1 Tax=hydrothermal vent metagenome TaxID=652676 RepID=A0A3B0XQC6_9ZZZZ